MKKQMNNVFCILTVLATLAFTVLPAMAASAVMRGVFGDDLTWRFTQSDRTLTVEGTGEMPSCLLWEFDFYGTETPWMTRGFYDKIERVVIGDGVTAVGSAAFQCCTALREVRLPETLRTICDCAFEHTALTEIRIPESVDTIGDSAFAYCEDLRSVTFAGRHAMDICFYAFGETPFLENAKSDQNGFVIRGGHLLRAETDLQGECTIPEGVTDIASAAFNDSAPECPPEHTAQITKVIFPKSLEYIASYAFEGCDKLSKVTFLSKNVRFGYYPFEETALPENKIKQYSAVCIGEPVEAPAPTEYRIGATDKEYAMNSFEKNTDDDCAAYYDRLQAYVVDPDNPYFQAVDGVLYSKDGTVLLRYPAGRTADTFVVPQGVKVIGADAFSQYRVKSPVGLRKVVLPDGVTVIRECAFDSCPNLEEVVLPSSLKTIDACAFSDNAALQNIELPDGLQEIGECFLSESLVRHVRIPDSVECIRGAAFYGSKLQTIEGYDRISYIGKYGMERESFSGTPYQNALDGITEEPLTAQQTEPDEAVSTEHMTPTLRILNTDYEEITEEHVKVGLFSRYKSSSVQLFWVADLPTNVRLRWCSDNKNVTVDENGVVTNRLHRRDTAAITLLAMNPDGTVLLDCEVRLYFYRFDFQLRKLQEQVNG